MRRCRADIRSGRSPTTTSTICTNVRRLAIAWNMVDAPTANEPDIIAALRSGRVVRDLAGGQERPTRRSPRVRVHESALTVSSSGVPATYRVHRTGRRRAADVRSGHAGDVFHQARRYLHPHRHPHTQHGDVPEPCPSLRRRAPAGAAGGRQRAAHLAVAPVRRPAVPHGAASLVAPPQGAARSGRRADRRGVRRSRDGPGADPGAGRTEHRVRNEPVAADAARPAGQQQPVLAARDRRCQRDQRSVLRRRPQHGPRRPRRRVPELVDPDAVPRRRREHHGARRQRVAVPVPDAPVVGTRERLDRLHAGRTRRARTGRLARADAARRDVDPRGGRVVCGIRAGGGAVHRSARARHPDAERLAARRLSGQRAPRCRAGSAW